jgi:hypothetical protein
MPRLLFLLKHSQNYDVFENIMHNWTTNYMSNKNIHVFNNYSSCFGLNHNNNHVFLKQKYYFMHFMCMIIILV